MSSGDWQFSSYKPNGECRIIKIGYAALHTVRFLFGIDEAETQTTTAERAALLQYVANSKRVLEIGVFEGPTTAEMAQALNAGAVLYGVDPFPPGRLGICWGEIIAKVGARRSGQVSQIHFVEMLSEAAAQEIDGNFDLILIDGDHSEEGIRTDWRMWSDRCTLGGVIALHDTTPVAYNPNVEKLGTVMYFRSHIQRDPRFQIVETVDSTNFLKRVGLVGKTPRRDSYGKGDK